MQLSDKRRQIRLIDKEEQSYALLRYRQPGLIITVNIDSIV